MLEACILLALTGAVEAALNSLTMLEPARSEHPIQAGSLCYVALRTVQPKERKRSASMAACPSRPSHGAK